LTQTQLAEKVGTKQPSIARLENGTTMPTLSSLKKIGKALRARVVIQFVSEN
jgi:predicted transcriptional regulator